MKKPSIHRIQRSSTFTASRSLAPGAKAVEMLLPGDVRAAREPQAELDAAIRAGAEPAPPGNEWEPEPHPLGDLDPDDVPPTAAPSTVVVDAPPPWAPIEPSEEGRRRLIEYHRDFPDRRARGHSPCVRVGCKREDRENVSEKNWEGEREGGCVSRPRIACLRAPRSTPRPQSGARLRPADVGVNRGRGDRRMSEHRGGRGEGLGYRAVGGLALD